MCYNLYTMSSTLKEIEERLKAGESYDSVQEDMNDILGPIDNSEHDLESDSDWEEFYRNSKLP
jgi:hypothetical protein